MGSPLEEASWNLVTGPYYAGAGNSEVLWIVVSIAQLVGALFMGARHETSAYKETLNTAKEKKDVSE